MITVTIYQGQNVRKLRVPYFTSLWTLRQMFNCVPGVAYIGAARTGWVYDGKTIRQTSDARR